MNSEYKDFNEQCYALLKLFPKGKVTTYKELARALGAKAWRAVGSAMAKNTRLLAIPCHRVVRSDGSVGQYAGCSQKIQDPGARRRRGHRWQGEGPGQVHAQVCQVDTVCIGRCIYNVAAC